MPVNPTEESRGVQNYQSQSCEIMGGTGANDHDSVQQKALGDHKTKNHLDKSDQIVGHSNVSGIHDVIVRPVQTAFSETAPRSRDEPLGRECKILCSLERPPIRIESLNSAPWASRRLTMAAGDWDHRGGVHGLRRDPTAVDIRNEDSKDRSGIGRWRRCLTENLVNCLGGEGVDHVEASVCARLQELGCPYRRRHGYTPVSIMEGSLNQSRANG